MSSPVESPDVTVFINKLKQFARVINDREVSFRLGRKCKEIVYRRIKSGYGVNVEGKDAEQTERVKLKPLSPGYIDYRKGLVIFRAGKNGQVFAIRGNAGKGSPKIKKPTLGEFGKPSKSNATLSGQMLDSMVIIADRDGFKLIIAKSPRRTDGGANSTLTNRDVADRYSANGRPFFSLTAGEIRILTRELELIISQKLRTLVR